MPKEPSMKFNKNIDKTLEEKIPKCKQRLSWMTGLNMVLIFPFCFFQIINMKYNMNFKILKVHKQDCS